jgi:hypothetical protein
MVFFVGFLLIILVGGYIGYPLFAKGREQQFCTREQLQRIEEEIEREILVLRKYSDKTET